ncbi:vWA domain-containing protein [Actinoplanes sp. RD1]|uniref:hypothetical protein n=1 Tax=Actinoplanes sp. RD1 TaxID=3064538 RepID=UPI0027428BD3|nr:hypothetical protein [Actinoplanes sp. RD1]
MPDSLRPAPGLSPRPALARTTGRWRSLLPLLLLVLLAGLLVVSWPDREEPPAAAPAAGPAPAPAVLRGYQLAGPRSAECLRLIIGLDVSGSMRDYTTARDAALVQLLSWAPRNLRADDEIAVVDFALEAQVRLRPVAVGELPGTTAAPVVQDGRDTLLDPMLARAAEFRATRCRVVVALLSDAAIVDLPASAPDGVGLLRDHRVDDIRLLVPSTTVAVPATWVAGFPQATPVHFDGLAEDRTALVIGQTLAGLTDQELRPLTASAPTAVPTR